MSQTPVKEKASKNTPRRRKKRRVKVSDVIQTKSEPLKRLQEPMPECLICGKPIDSIAQALGGEKEGTFAHFDCVLEQIRSEENLKADQKLSYIGKGTFAIIEENEEEKSFTIVKRIIYESPEINAYVKQYVEEAKV